MSLLTAVHMPKEPFPAISVHLRRAELAVDAAALIAAIPIRIGIADMQVIAHYCTNIAIDRLSSDFRRIRGCPP